MGVTMLAFLVQDQGIKGSSNLCSRGEKRSTVLAFLQQDMGIKGSSNSHSRIKKEAVSTILIIWSAECWPTFTFAFHIKHIDKIELEFN